MGNCLRTSNNKVLSNDDDHETQMELPRNPKDDLEQKIHLKKKNKVRFADEEEEEVVKDRVRDNHGESKTGPVRIKLVVTQEELKKILDFKKSGSKFASLEQLLSDMKLRGRSVTEVEKNSDANWSPALESIPEDH